jgi:hypothetical protein
MKRWIIAHECEPLAWCNIDGWVCPSNNPVERFTDEEKQTANLPMEGVWMEDEECSIL